MRPMQPRELVQRLILAELLARPGEGPLARRPIIRRLPAPAPWDAGVLAAPSEPEER